MLKRTGGVLSINTTHYSQCNNVIVQRLRLHKEIAFHLLCSTIERELWKIINLGMFSKTIVGLTAC